MHRHFSALVALTCASLLGCPDHTERDAGVEEPERDAGVGDAGCNGAGIVDAGEVEPGDGGPPAGEGEGECASVSAETIAVQPNDAGVLLLEECAIAELLFGDCPNSCCGASAVEQQMIELIRDVARERGYLEQVEIVRLYDDTEEIEASVAYIIDWARTRQRIEAPVDAEGRIDRREIEATMPAFLPTSLAPLATVVEDLRACSPDLLLHACHTGLWRSPSCWGWHLDLSGSGGFEDPTCKTAVVTLWDSCAPDAGMGEVRCYDDGVPCCPAQ